MRFSRSARGKEGGSLPVGVIRLFDLLRRVK
ncbi:hypothetical protein PANA5342_2734 [Pantoea ananatis LMG 5342]|nr:hypothetical protein PANA5342_2734 [Pantoea ananatis LMG 5342]